MNLNNYSFKFTPTETSAGGTLLYIANQLSYKCRNDQKIYNKNEPESIFIEIVNPKNKILLWESFTDIHLWTLLTLNRLLENISKGQKSVFLLGDFNAIQDGLFWGCSRIPEGRGGC